MANSNTEVLKFAQKFLGQGGGTFRSYCGLPAGTAYCNAFVTYVMHKTGNAKLYCNGTKQTYCPNSIQWCYKNLANIPIYLALPGDIIYFDWEPNGTPNHIGFVRERKSDQEIYTLEGNTSGGIVAKKTRTVKYVQAVFRPGYKAAFDTSKPLAIDGYFGYNSIAQLQRVLHVGIDGDLGQITVKALQKLVGVTADGSWGKKTSKAVQKLIGVKQDGDFGPASVKALQKWLNKQVEGFTDTKSSTTATSSKTESSKTETAKTETAKSTTTKATTETWAEKKIKAGLKWAKKIADDNDYHYVNWDGSEKAKECPICTKYGKGKYKGWNCIGYVAAILHHGMSLTKVKCANNGLIGGSQKYTELLSLAKSSTKKALTYWTQKIGTGKWDIIYNGGKNIPASKLEPGDIVIYYKGKDFWHIGMYYSKNKIIDCTSSKKNSPSVRNYRLTYPCLVAVRLTGK